MSSGYRVAPVFLIRMAGVPLDVIEKLATPRTSEACRQLLMREQRLSDAKAQAQELLHRRDNGLSPEEFHELRSAVRGNRVPKLNSDREEFVAYAKAISEFEKIGADFSECLSRELDEARSALLTSARHVLPRYLVFGGAGTAGLSAESISGELQALPPRNKRARERERHLLLYLQRIAAKNDTFSEFGPSGWGRIEPNSAGIRIEPSHGISAREVFMERWTAHAAAAGLNADPDVFPELIPRLNPNGRLEKNRFLLTDTAELIDLNSAQLDLIARCDGRTPVHALGSSIEEIRALVDRKVVLCQMEVPAMDPHAFEVLGDDVSHWRSGPIRDKWLSILQPLTELVRQFGEAQSVEVRLRLMQDARDRVEKLGGAREGGDRSLYSAKNAIGEECFRQCGFSITEDLINEAIVDAAPWIDMWRDCYAYVASRVAVGLRGIFEKMPAKNASTVPLPAFLRACEAARLPLTGPGLVALAVIAFQELKAAFRETMAGKTDQAEHELTIEECHFVRQKFRYPPFDEYTYPSADLQICARSAEEVANGNYSWVLAELHPPVALLHHGGYWSCPDKDLLNTGFEQATGGKPNFHFGFFAADFTSHTTVRLFDALPNLSYFVSGQRANPKWRSVRPADAEVFVDPATGDVCLRRIDDHTYLGSFARAWLIPLGFHPFQFGMMPHMPRLLCGRVVVQRRAWTVSAESFPPGNYTGVSRDLVVGVEKMRATLGLPRFVYVRPTEQALRRSGAEGRDKDTKPVFIDLESYLFLEIFHRWLFKAGELEITEMLPAPDQLPWREPDGRRTFELRTLVVPRS